MKPSSVYRDPIRDRYLIKLADGSLMKWDHEDWCAICWVVGGRTDTDFEKLDGNFVYLFNEEDAKLAIWAVRRHQRLIAELTVRYEDRKLICG